MKKSSQAIIITAGEPAGIGPELLVMLAQQEWPVPLVACADGDLLQHRARMLNLPLRLQPWRADKPAKMQAAGTLTHQQVSLQTPVYAGELDPRNSQYVMQTLTRACQGCLKGEFAALVTGPVHKGVINDAGIPFSGHTEYLAELSHCPHVVMMLAHETLRVALATTHLPLSAVPAAITRESLSETLRILHHSLQRHFAISAPRIVVCGLNPHAGEGGHLGHEELEVIIPVLEKLRQQRMHLMGPLPADTLFQDKYLQNADAVLSMYHDQGLPVLKSQGFGRSINITLGLPFIRTSVDHGTALELAGKGMANPGSFIQAVNSAIQMSQYGYA